jgi:glycine/D-amino acid oxidase-like deaminating enzyme
VRVELLIHAWRNRLAKRNQLVEAEFDSKKLLVTDQGFNYEDIEFKKIIYCDGISLQNHSLPHVIPLAPTKGEALIVKIPGLPTDAIFKNKLTLLPMKQIEHWWVGSSVEWEFENERPTDNFKAQTLQALENWLALPIELIEQRAAIRMGTMERRPLVGMQGLDKKVGYLNGMGTKGCSLAPYFAQQLVRNILWDEPIHYEANWARFA